MVTMNKSYSVRYYRVFQKVFYIISYHNKHINDTLICFRIRKLFPNMSFAKLVPGDWVVPEGLDLEAVQNFPIYEDDVWIVTPPKCGTTW
jgi:hypothetical protein